MRRLQIFFAVALLFGVIQAKGSVELEQTTNVPIARLLANLEGRLARGSNDVEVHYDLGRVYSMPYATNIPVDASDSRPYFGPFEYFPRLPEPRELARSAGPQERKQAQSRLANAIFHYRQAASLLASETNGSPNQWLVLPIHLGLSWCLDQAGQTNDAINAYRKTLELAWNTEVAGQMTLKERTTWAWERLRSGKNPFASPPPVMFLGPGSSYSEETIGYLLKLLDRVKDAKEIARLKETQKVLGKMGRVVSPILVSLARDSTLADLTNPKARVAFDLDGSGLPRKWGWITPKAAWLVWDPAAEGRITSGLQMFGIVTFWVFWRDGYAALSALDDNGDGVLRGPELKGLALWRDENGDGVCDPGEVRPVEDWGITGIRCGCGKDGSGVLWNPAGVELRDGTTRGTWDWVVEGGDE
jgi:hypothetical protein